MTVELAQKRLEYWMEKLDLYEHVECLQAAQNHPALRDVLTRLGHKVPRGYSLPKQKNRKYIAASDDWFPCYRGGKVAVTWHNNEKYISVWGADDFGMGKTDTTRAEYDAIIANAPISQDMLKKMGFTTI
jgi:hypothetical protein